MNNKPARFEHFTGFPALDKLCDTSRPFFLLYKVVSSIDTRLKPLTDKCLNTPSVRGIIFIVEDDDLESDDVFFLKSIIESLLFANKRAGLWGVPECFQRKLLGGYLYMRYRHQAIVQAVPRWAGVSDTPGHEICINCIDRDICTGPGKRAIQLYQRFAKRKQKQKQGKGPASQACFKTHSDLLNQKHSAYIKHCRRIESPSAYRTVYYVTNINYHSEYAYQNRFIYQCDYLSPDEYQFEYAFLKNNAINPAYAERLASLSKIQNTSQIAYSLAEKGGRFRESFYMFVTRQYGSKLLDDFGIHYKYPHTPDMQFIGAGIDVIDGEEDCYKLYFLSPKKFIANYFADFEIRISDLKSNTHYLVLRLDKHQQLRAYKIELLFMYDDLPIIEPLLKDYPYFKQHLKQGEKYNIAVEFEENKISKVNVYHRSRLPT